MELDWKGFAALWGAALSTWIYLQQTLSGRPACFILPVQRNDGEQWLKLVIQNTDPKFPIFVHRITADAKADETAAISRIYVDGFNIRDVIHQAMTDELDVLIPAGKSCSVEMLVLKGAPLNLRVSWERHDRIVRWRRVIRVRRTVEHLRLICSHPSFETAPS